MQTLKDAGYPGWPYIHGAAGGVCFVWFSRSLATGRVCKDLAWTIFRMTRDTGRLVRRNGHLVPAHVPTEHYGKSLEALRTLALKSPALYRLRKGKEWVGPVLYMEPAALPEVGDESLSFALLAAPPAHSEGQRLSYLVNPCLEPSLQLEAAR